MNTNMVRLGLKACGGFLIIILLVTSCFFPHMNRQTYNVTVNEKIVKRYDNADRYLIITTTSNGESIVFENTDSLIEKKFNSSDIYAQLKQNNKYQIDVYGYRVPFLSWYQNILSAKEI